MSRYQWTITEDRVTPAGAEGHAVGVIGPRGAELSAGEIIARGVPFRMRDDDGELYYVGAFVGDSTSEDGFGPLDDYGRPNAGCTSIEYRRAGVWEVL